MMHVAGGIKVGGKGQFHLKRNSYPTINPFAKLLTWACVILAVDDICSFVL